MLRDKEKGVEKIADKIWWKIITGGVLITAALVCFIVYYLNPGNVIMPILFVFTGLPGAYLVYIGWNRQHTGFKFTNTTKKRATGRENCINIYSYFDEETGYDVPVLIDVVEMKNPPKGQKHYVRNFKRHFFENYNNTKLKKLQAVKLKDQKYCPPSAAVLPLTMQPVLDYYQYAPPSTLAKLAPWILIVAMVIIGIMMVITGPSPTG